MTNHFYSSLNKLCRFVNYWVLIVTIYYINYSISYYVCIGTMFLLLFTTKLILQNCFFYFFSVVFIQCCLIESLSSVEVAWSLRVYINR